MSVLDMEKYFHDEKFEFLVVKTFDMGCYGFNLKCTDQCATAKKIIQYVNSFIVNGWKVARRIPKWIHSFNAWNDFMNAKCSRMKSEENHYEEGNNDDDNKDFKHKEEEEEEGEEEEEVEEEEERQEDKEEEEEEEEEKEEEEEEEEEENPMTQADDNDVFNQMTEKDLKNKMSKHVVDTVKSNSEDENVFKSICGGVLRKKLAESNTFKSNSIDIHITGPFHNKKTSKSHWVVVFLLLFDLLYGRRNDYLHHDEHTCQGTARSVLLGHM
jgi:hypothetical protein